MSKVCSKAADRVAQASGFVIHEPIYHHPMTVNKLGETMASMFKGGKELKGRMTKRRIKTIIRNW
jgi:hypothetical protein